MEASSIAYGRAYDHSSPSRCESLTSHSHGCPRRGRRRATGVAVDHLNSTFGPRCPPSVVVLHGPRVRSGRARWCAARFQGDARRGGAGMPDGESAASQPVNHTRRDRAGDNRRCKRRKRDNKRKADGRNTNGQTRHAPSRLTAQTRPAAICS